MSQEKKGLKATPIIIVLLAVGVILAGIIYFSGPNPIVKDSEGWRHWQIVKGVWGEAKVTVENKGGGGDVIIWAKWTSGGDSYKGETKVHMDAGETLIVTVNVPISDNVADYDLSWEYECGARKV